MTAQILTHAAALSVFSLAAFLVLRVGMDAADRIVFMLTEGQGDD